MSNEWIYENLTVYSMMSLVSVSREISILMLDISVLSSRDIDEPQY